MLLKYNINSRRIETQCQGLSASIRSYNIFTCGILKSLSKFATWIDVTLEAAPTTPDITFRTWVLLQWYSAPSMLLIEPEIHHEINANTKII